MDITLHKFNGQPNIATTANQIHLHSTGNPKATIENEVKYLVDNGGHKNAFYTHIVGQGKVYQVVNTGRGAWDVGGGLQSAVQQFQSVTGLSSDGVVGPDTAYKLFAYNLNWLISTGLKCVILALIEIVRREHSS